MSQASEEAAGSDSCVNGSDGIGPLFGEEKVLIKSLLKMDRSKIGRSPGLRTDAANVLNLILNRK